MERAFSAADCSELYRRFFLRVSLGSFPAAVLDVSLALRAVVSYTTFSPLPATLANRGRYILCGTIRRDDSRRHLPRVSPAEPELRGIAPYGVRTFLP